MARIDNNYFTYRQTPTTENGTGTLESIKGNTLVWNQLIKKGNMTDGWTFSNSTGSYANNILTFTASAQGGFVRPNNPQSIVANHKYLAMVDVKGASAFTSTINFTSRNLITANITTNWQTFSLVFTNTITEGNFFPRVYDYRRSDWDAIQIRNCMLFDLTQMGLDITDPSEFTSLFSLPYYDYNQGSLLSFNGNGIKTVGKNLFNAEWESGSIGGTGNNIPSANDIRTSSGFSAFFFEEGKTYTFSCEETRQEIWVNYYFNDGTFQRTRIGANTTSASFTVPNGVRLIRFRMTKTSNDLEPKTQVEYGTSASSYVPYTESVLSLPISTYFPNGMNGKNNVYDELTREKATKRFGTCSISDFSTTGGVSAGGLHYADFTPTQAPVFGSFNILTSAGLPVLGGNEAWESTVPCISANATRLRVYGTTTDINTEFSGMQIMYDLATPIETVISPSLDLTFNIDQGGTEELLPTNTSTPTTTPILCDIFYRGMIPVSVNVYPLGSGTVTGSGEYRYGETATLVATSNDGIYRFLRYEDENGQTLSTDSTYSFKVGE